MARDLLGVTDAALLDELVDAVSARDGRTVFDVIARVVEAGHDPRRFANDLLDRFKDLIVVQRVPDAVERELVDCPPDQGPRLVQQAGAMGPAELSRAADLLYAGLTEMRGTTSPRLTLELVCARILLPAAATDDAGLMARMDRLERRLAIAGDAPSGSAHHPPADATPPASRPRVAAPPPAREEPDEPPGMTAETAAPADAPVTAAAAPTADAPAPPEAPVAAEAPSGPAPAAAAEPVAPGALDAAAVRRVWDQVLDAISRRSRTTRALLDNALVTSVTDRDLTLCFRDSPLVGIFGRGSNSDHVAAALREVLGVDWRVNAVFRDEAGDCVDDARADASRTAVAAPRASSAAVDDFAPGDEPAPEPADGAPPANGRRTEEDPSIALAKSMLGAQVISEHPTEH